MALKKSIGIFIMLLLFPLKGMAETFIPKEEQDSISENIISQAEALSDTLDNKSKEKKGNFIYRFFKKMDEYDTAYISPNYYNYTAMLQNTNFYQQYRLSAKNEEGAKQVLNFSPAPALKIGPYVGWRWIFLGYTFDMSRPRSAGKSTEFNLSLYSSMLGCDLIYIKNTGNFTMRNVNGFDDIDNDQFRGRSFKGLDTYTLSFNAYYVCNHKKFSYPAAYAQSTVQRKSCGSWIFGFRFDRQKIKFDYTKLPEELVGNMGSESKIIEELKWKKIDYYNYSLSTGYAYNWVFAKNFLLAISCTPAIGFKKAKGEKLHGEEFLLNIRNLSFDFISRAGIVWNNTHWFAGASFINHLYDYRRDKITLTNSINYLNLYVGFNFHRKSQYRKNQK